MKCNTINKYREEIYRRVQGIGVGKCSEEYVCESDRGEGSHTHGPGSPGKGGSGRVTCQVQ